LRSLINSFSRSSWNTLLANEVQVHAPSNWIDTTIARQRRARRPTTATSTFTCSSTSLMSDDKRGGGGGEQQTTSTKLQNTRTVWTFSRIEETTFPIAASNILDQNLVFEFSMPVKKIFF